MFVRHLLDRFKKLTTILETQTTREEALASGVPEDRNYSILWVREDSVPARFVLLRLVRDREGSIQENEDFTLLRFEILNKLQAIRTEAGHLLFDNIDHLL